MTTFYIGQKVLVIGGVTDLIGQTATIIDQLECEGLGTIHQLDILPTVGGQMMFFQSKHLMPIWAPTQESMDELWLTLGPIVETV